jgi:RNase P subunit RPR2
LFINRVTTRMKFFNMVLCLFKFLFDYNMSFSRYYLNCWVDGHRRDGCRKPNEIWMNQGYVEKNSICYKCNNFGHISRNCRLPIDSNRSQPRRSSIKCFNCSNNGHIVMYCRYDKSINEGRLSIENKNEDNKHIKYTTHNTMAFLMRKPWPRKNPSGDDTHKYALKYSVPIRRPSPVKSWVLHYYSPC